MSEPAHSLNRIVSVDASPLQAVFAQHEEETNTININDATAASAHATIIPDLAFSGGGIRSASYCIGVLRDYLLAFNEAPEFLSCVSGGGYVGSSFTHWARIHALPLINCQDNIKSACGPAPTLDWFDNYFQHFAANVGYLIRDPYACRLKFDPSQAAPVRLQPPRFSWSRFGSGCMDLLLMLTVLSATNLLGLLIFIPPGFIVAMCFYAFCSPQMAAAIDSSTFWTPVVVMGGVGLVAAVLMGLMPCKFSTIAFKEKVRNSLKLLCGSCMILCMLYLVSKLANSISRTTSHNGLLAGALLLLITGSPVSPIGSSVHFLLSSFFFLALYSQIICWYIFNDIDNDFTILGQRVQYSDLGLLLAVLAAPFAGILSYAKDSLLHHYYRLRLRNAFYYPPTSGQGRTQSDELTCPPSCVCHHALSRLAAAKFEPQSSDPKWWQWWQSFSAGHGDAHADGAVYRLVRGRMENLQALCAEQYMGRLNSGQFMELFKRCALSLPQCESTPPCAAEYAQALAALGAPLPNELELNAYIELVQTYLGRGGRPATDVQLFNSNWATRERCLTRVPHYIAGTTVNNWEIYNSSKNRLRIQRKRKLARDAPYEVFTLEQDRWSRIDNDYNHESFQEAHSESISLSTAMAISAACIAFGMGALQDGMKGLQLVQGFFGLNLGKYVSRFSMIHRAHIGEALMTLLPFIVFCVAQALAVVAAAIDDPESARCLVAVAALWAIEMFVFIPFFNDNCIDFWPILREFRRIINIIHVSEVDGAGVLASDQLGPGTLNLSDGGHSENLALLPLLARRRPWIVVCDGGHEAGQECEALLKAIKKARETLQCEFFLHADGSGDVETELRRKFIPSQAARCFAFCVRYDDGSVGRVMFLKPRYSGLLQAATSAEQADLDKAAADQDGLNGCCCFGCHRWYPSALSLGRFPNHSTGNQFFTCKLFVEYANEGHRAMKEAREQMVRLKANGHSH